MKSPAHKYLDDLDSAFDLAHPNILRKRASKAQPKPFETIVIGHNDDGETVVIDDRPRLEHMHVIGATGSGKSTLLEGMIRADVQRGRGVAVFDPHGNHPDSIYHRTLAWLDKAGFVESGRVHIIDPNIRSHTVGFNPLARLPNTDISVIADALVQAFERVWSEENTHNKPTIRTILKATFMALAEIGATLAEAKLLYDESDQHGFRARVLAGISNEFALAEISRLHAISLDERNRRDFRAEVIGPINRLNEFVSSDAIRMMLGQTEQSIDLLKLMDDGGVLLVNLQDGRTVSEADTRLLGTMLLRYLFLLAARRRHQLPFFIYIDECHRYLSGDIPNLLAESRKPGLGLVLAHQFLSQAGKPGDLIYEALMNSTEIKAAFRIKGPIEARAVAEMVMPLDLEMPVRALIKPAAVAQEIIHLRSASEAEHTANSITRGVAEAFAEMEATAVSQAMGQFAGAGASQLMTVEQGWLALPTALSQTISDSKGSSSLSGTSLSKALSRSVAHTVAKSMSAGRSISHGVAEALGTVYRDLPSTVHSKENVLHLAGEAIRNFPVGRAFLKFRNVAAAITITRPTTVEADVALSKQSVLERSPAALPLPIAVNVLNTRREALLRTPRQAVDHPPMPQPDLQSDRPVDQPPQRDFWEQTTASTKPKVAKTKKGGAKREPKTKP